MTKLDAALDLARRGFRVFPCDENGKTPAIDKWPERATTDEVQIRAWWCDPVMNWEQPYNPAIATGAGLLVVDLDTKRGKDGVKAWATLEDLEEPIGATLRVKTPSGGEHIYLRVDQPYGNTAKKLAEGIDTRCDGGYVLAPGAEIDGKAYEIIEDRAQNDLPAAPAWLTATLAAPRAQDGKELVTALDTPYALFRAVRWLEQDAPLAVEGSGGDQQTYAVAARVKDFGLSRSAALQAMLEFWNERCSPPWPPRELETKVANAFRYGSSAPGVLDPAKEFTAIDPPASERGLHYVRFEDARPDTAAAYLVEDLLDQGVMSVLYGDSNSGKTFLALDLAHCVAMGRPWRGKRVRRGLVVYVAAEGGRSIHKRLAALRERHGAQDVALALVPCPVDLLRPNGDVKALVALIQSAEAEYGLPAVMVVIDTLSRAMAGGNENAPDDMGAFVMNVDKVRATIHAHVLIVHHTGKDAAKGARGHSLLRAATDTEVEVAERMVSITKQRDMDYGQPFRFDLEVVTVGQTVEGKAITTCLVRYPTGLEAVMTDDMKLALECLRQACAESESEKDPGGDSQQPPSASWTVWKAIWRARIGVSPEAPKNCWGDKRLRALREVGGQKGLISTNKRNQYFIQNGGHGGQ